MRRFSGQGATEYLVLLAVVLVIALVGIALLGFFPGTASDAQIAESQIYWKSASPIAIVEMDAMSHQSGYGETSSYLRIRNTGAYPLRIVQILGNGNNLSVIFTGSVVPVGDYFYLAPGEEKYFASSWMFGLPLERYFGLTLEGGYQANAVMNAATSVCNPTVPPSGGMIYVKNFGFEYVQYVEGQQITKRQIGNKPLIIKCR